MPTRADTSTTGRDARGRKQYRYHEDWTRIRGEAKFEQLTEFGAALPALRARVQRDTDTRGMDKNKVVALVLAILDRTLVRVGNDEYARENDTFGLTTLQRRHLTLRDRSVRMRFEGKGGVPHDVTLTDRRLTRLVRRCHELGGKEVFTYLDSDGTPVRVDSSDCNDYLRREIGADVTVKTFRTWGASSDVVEFLAYRAIEDGDAAMIEAVDHAAALLRNTRTVCRKSYVHPTVETSFRSGDLLAAWRRSRQSTWMERSERTLLRLLGD